MRKFVLVVIAILSLTSCTHTSVIQLSQNEILLNTAAAPICGSTGSMDVAQQMAAVETLRRGFDRYLVGGAAAQNNVGVLQTGPTYSKSSGSATVVGNTVYGSSTTQYGGQQTIFYGSHDTSLRLLLLRPGDIGFDKGIDARAVLGQDWQQKVEDGVNTC